MSKIVNFGTFVEKMIIKNRTAVYSTLVIGSCSLAAMGYHIQFNEIPAMNKLSATVQQSQQALDDMDKIADLLVNMKKKYTHKQYEKNRKKLFKNIEEIGTFMEKITDELKSEGFTVQVRLAKMDTNDKPKDEYGFDMYKIKAQLSIRNVSADGSGYKRLLKIINDVPNKNKICVVEKVDIRGGGYDIATSAVELSLWSLTPYE